MLISGLVRRLGSKKQPGEGPAPPFPTRDAHRGPGLTMPALADELRPEAERIAADLAPDLPPEAATALVAAWAQLFGLIGFELFGQFHRVVEDRERFFRHAVTHLARGVGLA